jgi:hypothetical protein
MTYLSDTARVVLAAAAQRDDLSVLPFPDGCKAKGGAEQKVLSGLKKRGLIRVIGAEGGPQRVVITSEGMAAIGVEPEDDTPERATPGNTGATPADAGVQAVEAPAQATEADGAATPAKRRPRRRRPSRARLRRPRSPRHAPAPSRP